MRDHRQSVPGPCSKLFRSFSSFFVLIALLFQVAAGNQLIWWRCEKLTKIRHSRIFLRQSQNSKIAKLALVSGLSAYKVKSDFASNTQHNRCFYFTWFHKFSSVKTSPYYQLPLHSRNNIGNSTHFLDRCTDIFHNNFLPHCI